jgi:hypothetical protein
MRPSFRILARTMSKPRKIPVADARDYAGIEEQVETLRAGQTTTGTTPGDFVLTHGHGIISGLIRFGQAIHFRGERSHYAHWTHCALIVGTNGEIVEARAGGVHDANLNVEYAEKDRVIVRMDGSDQRDRDQAVAFAASCVGDRYGFLTIIGIAIWILCGGGLVIGLARTEICSVLVAEALTRYGVIWPRNPAMLMPAEIAEFYDVPTPP